MGQDAIKPAGNAGTVTSVTSTGGSITVTNGAGPVVNVEMDVLTTKGDLLTQSANGTFARVGIGSTGQALGVGAGLPAWAFPPGYEYAYTERTTNVSVAATSSATPTDLGLSAGALTFDGTTRVCIEALGVLDIISAASNVYLLVTLYDGTLDAAGRMGTLLEINLDNANETRFIQSSRVYFTPAAGIHTYRLGGWGSSVGTKTFMAGTGTTVGSGNGVEMPAYIRVTHA